MNSALTETVHVNEPGRINASRQSIPDQYRLTIDPILLGRIVSHMQRCLPVEGVGLIGTTRGEDGLIADAYYPGTNTAASTTRYAMDPHEVRRALNDMARAGTFLGAIVHSHPATIAEPSPIDLREATLPDALSIIVAFEPRLSIRAWRLLFSPSGRAFDAVECPIAIATAGAGTRADPWIVEDWPNA